MVPTRPFVQLRRVYSSSHGIGRFRAPAVSKFKHHLDTNISTLLLPVTILTSPTLEDASGTHKLNLNIRFLENLQSIRHLHSSYAHKAERSADDERVSKIYQSNLEHLKPPDTRGLLSIVTTLISNMLEVTPHVSDLTPNIRFPENPQVIAYGGFSDVYKAEYQGTEVAVKVLRAIPIGSLKSEDSISRKLCREIRIWSSLDHPNVLPFLGTYFFAQLGGHSRNHLSMVSPWMNHGAAQQYLLERPIANRVHLLCGVASGLLYIHDKGVVHGDLKGSNILVDCDGTPLLCDFGFATFYEENTDLHSTSGETTSTRGGEGTFRWMAPEIVDGEGSTKESDMWAFGCTVLELMTSRLPYTRFRGDSQVIYAIMQKKLPWEPSPESSDDLALSPPEFQHHRTIWDLCLQCWNTEPAIRPTAHQSLIDLLEAKDTSNDIQLQECELIA